MYFGTKSSEIEDTVHNTKRICGKRWPIHVGSRGCFTEMWSGKANISWWQLCWKPCSHVPRSRFHLQPFHPCIRTHIAMPTINHFQMQTQNINQLTEAVIETATKHGTLQVQAKAVQTMFKKLFTVFAKCHDTYSRAKPMKDEEIDQFSKTIAMVRLKYIASNSKLIPSNFAGVTIDPFLQFYRENFPLASIIPKLHLLEDHMVP